VTPSPRLVSDAPCVHPVHFLCNPHDSSRSPRLVSRDGLAMIELCAAFAELGYRIGEQYVNWPGRCQLDAHGDYVPPSPNGLRRVTVVADPLDLVLTATRVVIDPEEEVHERRGSLPAETDLEFVIGSCWRSWFKLFTRTTASLAADLHPLLLDGYHDRKAIVFRQERREHTSDESEASHYRMLSRKAYTGEPRTAAFLLRVPELWAGGPGYVGLCGMTASIAGAFARIVRKRMLDLLREPGFTMVELSPGPIPECATDLRFADSWDARVILHKPIEPRSETQLGTHAAASSAM